MQKHQLDPFDQSRKFIHIVIDKVLSRNYWATVLQFLISFWELLDFLVKIYLNSPKRGHFHKS